MKYLYVYMRISHRVPPATCFPPASAVEGIKSVPSVSVRLCVCSSVSMVCNEWFKVVLEGYRRCPDSQDLSECHHLYDLGRHTLRPLLAAKNLLPPIS